MIYLEEIRHQTFQNYKAAKLTGINLYIKTKYCFINFNLKKTATLSGSILLQINFIQTNQLYVN